MSTFSQPGQDTLFMPVVNFSSVLKRHFLTVPWIDGDVHGRVHP